MVDITEGDAAGCIAPGTQYLVAGVVVLLVLLPIVRQAGLMFPTQSRSVVAATLMLQASTALMILMSRIRCRRQRVEQRLAATLANAIRRGLWQ